MRFGPRAQRAGSSPVSDHRLLCDPGPPCPRPESRQVLSTWPLTWPGVFLAGELGRQEGW